MKKTYTLPEAFMQDANVALKWKLYAILNGFWTNGLTVYAANKYFAEILGCSERAVSASLAELEEARLVRREVHGYKRTIHPYGNIEQTEAQLPARVKPSFRQARSPASGKGEAQLQPNAPSNAPNKKEVDKSTSSFQGTGLEQDEEEGNDMDIVPCDDEGNPLPPAPEKAKREGKNKVALRLLAQFSALAQKELKQRPVHGFAEYKMMVEALKHLSEDQVSTMLEDWFQEGRSDEETISIRKCLSHHHLEQYKLTL